VAERSQLLRTRLDRLTRSLRAIDDGDVRSLDRVRTAARRVRELLPLLELHPDRARKIGRRLRKVMRRLGTVRELDVVMLLIDELHVSRRSHSAALSRVGVAVSTQRDEARTRLFEHEPADGLRRIAKRLGKAADDLQEKSSKAADARAWRWAVDARVARRGSQLRAAIEHAGGVYLPERLHAVRRALVKLWYSLELATELNAARRAKSAAEQVTPDERLLRRGEDILGKMRDLQALIEHVRETQAAVSPPNLTVWHEFDMLARTLDDDCRRLHARYMRMRSPLMAIADKLSARRKGQPAVPRSAQQVG
jgi:CHAD domain-containing protein